MKSTPIPCPVCRRAARKACASSMRPCSTRGGAACTPTPAGRRSLSARTLGPGASTMLWPGQTESATTSPCGTARETLCVRHDAGRVAAGGRDPRNRLCPAGRRAVLPGRRDRQADENRAGLFRGGAHPVERHPLQDGRDHPRAEGLLQAVPAGGPGGRVLAQGGDQRG